MANRSIAIASYTMRVRPYGSAREYCLLGKIGEAGSLLSFLQGFFVPLKKAHAKAEEHAHVVRVERMESDGLDISGILEAGEYGFSAYGVNIETLASSYSRTPSDAELVPFFFRVHVPPGNDKGILLLQRFGSSGVMTVLQDQLCAAFSKAFPRHVLEFSRLVPAAVLERLIHGTLHEIQVTTHSVPSDLADKLKFMGNQPHVGSLTLTMKAKRKVPLVDPPWLRQVRERKTTLVEIPSEMGKDARIRLKLHYLGKTRQVCIDRPETMAPYTDVTQDVEILASGHPAYESIKAYSERLRDDLIRELGMG